MKEDSTFPQSSRTEASPSDYLVSYPGYYFYLRLGWDPIKYFHSKSVDLGVMIMKVRSAFHIAPGSKPYHQMQFRVIARTLVPGYRIPLQRCVLYSPPPHTHTHSSDWDLRHGDSSFETCTCLIAFKFDCMKWRLFSFLFFVCRIKFLPEHLSTLR